VERTDDRQECKVTREEVIAHRDDIEYWGAKTSMERLCALEHLRRIEYGDAACDAPIQRVMRIYHRNENGEDVLVSEKWFE
jgi:hypothetical protein